MSRAIDDRRLQRILEACYDAICAGSEPDLDALCADAPELRTRIERMLRRERQLIEVSASGGAALASAALPPPALPGQVGDFVILEAIGVGGMSQVFRARQEPFGREVALKVLRDDLVRSTTSRLRFAREATITASLEHPHIVPVYAAGEADGRVFLAMKLLRGRSLDQHDTPMRPDNVARIGCDVAAALQAAHDVGVVHRDLKPANVVVENGHAFVVDFGLAAFCNQTSLLTQPNSTPGTLIYLPPEVARRRASGLDPRADVYGLGATLYELLAGRPPFDPSNPVRALHQILHQEPAPLALRGADRDLETIVLRAMDKSPTRRFQTAGELHDELQRYREGLPIRSRRPNVAARAARAMGRHPTTTTLVAVTLLLAGVLLLQTLWQHRRDVASLQLDVDACTSALAAGDLVQGRRLVDQIAGHPLGGRALAAAERAWQRERDLQLLIATLQHPILRDNRAHLDALRARLADARPPAEQPARQLMALALCALAVDDRSADVPAHVDEQLPRATAAFAAWREGLPTGQALASLADRTGGDHDHLLAAAALRLTGEPERAVEDELRRARRGGDAALLFESLRLSLIAQGRHREAYDLARQVLDHPVCQVPARWATARLAATLGDLAAARAFLRQAERAAPADPLLRVLGVPSELAVLSEYDPEAFWPRWRAAPTSCQSLPQYWRLAGYVASDDGGPGDLDQAREYFERGLACTQRPALIGGLEVALLQLEWRRLVSSAPAGDDENARAELQLLAGRAELLVERAAQQHLPDTIVADALLVGAQASAQLGEWPRARRHFDHAADLGAPSAMSEFAWSVAQCCLYELPLDDLQAAPDWIAARAGDPSLPDDARAALERARRVLTMTADDRAVREETRAASHDAALVLSAYLGDALRALPLAAAWRPSGYPEDLLLQQIAADLLAGGGVALSLCDVRAPARRGGLGNAPAAVDRAWRDGVFTTRQAKDAVAAWRRDERLGATVGSPEWAAFWRDVGALERRLDAPR